MLDSLVVLQCFQGVEGKEEKKKGEVIIHLPWSLILMVVDSFHK